MRVSEGVTERIALLLVAVMSMSCLAIAGYFEQQQNHTDRRGEQGGHSVSVGTRAETRAGTGHSVSVGTPAETRAGTSHSVSVGTPAETGAQAAAPKSAPHKSFIITLTGSPYSGLPYEGLPERVLAAKKQYLLAKRHRAAAWWAEGLPAPQGMPSEPNGSQKHKLGEVRVGGRALHPTPRALLSSRGTGMFGISVSEWRPFRATWYCAQGGIGSGLVTATGEPVRDHWTVAVDPHVIPLGSTIQVKFPDGETELLRASDTGGAIVGNRLDIFDHSRSQCLANGVQDVEVRVFQRQSESNSAGSG